MKRAMQTKATMAVAVLLAVGVVAGTASAAPLTMERDRTDNTYYFEYDPATGEIGTESSSLMLKRRDRVAFFVYIREAAPAEGERLKANVSLRLNGDRAVRYKGTFSLVRDDAGALVLKEDLERRIVLRPRKGERRSRFSIPFDLDTYGLNYEAKAIFRSSS